MVDYLKFWFAKEIVEATIIVVVVLGVVVAACVAALWRSLR